MLAAAPVMRAPAATAAALLLLASPADAVLNETGNGNTEAPATDDPGWAYLGRLGVLNGVYLGYGWVLTAAHVGMGGGVFSLDGVPYPVVPGTRFLIAHDASRDADLAVMKIDPYPDPEELPPLPIAASAPGFDDPVWLIGQGRNRGDEIPGQGWEWAPSLDQRWGTNQIGGFVNGVGIVSEVLVGGASNRLTRSLVTEFNQFPDTSISPHECAATTGDSGGGLFTEVDPGEFALAGIQIAIGLEGGQTPETTLYGNDTYSANLAYYRREVLDLVRACDDEFDNDGDGQADLADGGCLWEGDFSELPACQDGFDNDFDGLEDWPADPDCASADDLFEASDLDGDFVPDGEDNCLEVANAPQQDSDADGFGNACDFDYNDDGTTALPDLVTLSAGFGSSTGDPRFDEQLDATGDGTIGTEEYTLFSARYGSPPGPSGHACAGSAPCP